VGKSPHQPTSKTGDPDEAEIHGEDVWEPDSDKAKIIKLDPEDVLTTQQAATLLAPLIKPLPSS
jgi:hypothetical protein